MDLLSPPVLSESLSAKLAALRIGVGRNQSDHELAQVFADISALPANLVVRASREIARKAGLGWWQSPPSQRVVVARGIRLRWERLKQRFKRPARKSPSEQELLIKNHNYAWLFLFHPNGHIREAALDSIRNAPTSPFFFAVLAWRLNDWAPPVRKAAERCANRVMLQTTATVVADAALYLLDRRHAWSRWSDEAEVLDRVFERGDVMAELATLLRHHPTGPLATSLRHALRYPAIDEHLPRLAAAAVQPPVRAVAYKCLISGKAIWPVGFDWIWVDKVYGLRKSVPKLETREIGQTRPAADLIREAVYDKSAFVRRIAADALIAARSQSQPQMPDEEKLIAYLAADRSSAVRSRADYLLRHPRSGQTP